MSRAKKGGPDSASIQMIRSNKRVDTQSPCSIGSAQSHRHRTCIMKVEVTMRLFLALLLGLLPVDKALAFSPSAASFRWEVVGSSSISESTRWGILPRRSSNDDNADDDNDNEDDEDWRTFRAKLVMSEGGSSSSSTPSSTIDDDGASATAAAGVLVDDDDLDGFGALFSSSSTSSTAGFTPLSPSQWAYDSGKIIEKGAVILGGVEQDFGFGLRQQYFHKSVILVLDHDDKFTKGIILNRPSDRLLDDTINSGLRWRVWFGGDVQGFDTPMPDILCLHSLRSKEAREASVLVMKDIQWTTFENAQKLVQRGVATGPDDFWLFAGYAGWGPQQLSGELDRKSWYMCATDSQTLLTELARQGRGVDPRDAGLETWTLLMNMIGRGETATRYSSGFDDYMLKEWSAANLIKIDGEQSPLVGGIQMSGGTANKLMMDASKLASSSVDITPGTILRASSADRSPFLLSKQELHHSLILILIEDGKVVLGCMLNHPSTKGCDIGSSGAKIPIRYGGDFAIKNQSPMMWLHCRESLLELGLGMTVGDQSKGIYKCTQEEASIAIKRGIASANDFLVLSGVSLWPKHSLANDVERGIFEVVNPAKVGAVINALQKQDILTKDNLDKSLALGEVAWEKAAAEENSYSSNRREGDTLTLGVGEGYDEEDETVVFNSDKKVSELANDALKKWVATYLLGAPTLA